MLLAGLALVIQPAMAGDSQAGQEKSALCAGCHGSDGISVMPLVPNLAGQKPAYLANAIRAYKDGSRKNAMMASVAAGLSDKDIEDLAAYYASLGE